MAILFACPIRDRRSPQLYRRDSLIDRLLRRVVLIPSWRVWCFPFCKLFAWGSSAFRRRHSEPACMALFDEPDYVPDADRTRRDLFNAARQHRIYAYTFLGGLLFVCLRRTDYGKFR